MPNRLPIPDNLQHLIEKRDVEDRRSTERRTTTPRPKEHESTADQALKPATDVAQQDNIPPEHATTERRRRQSRRKANRRKAK